MSISNRLEHGSFKSARVQKTFCVIFYFKLTVPLITTGIDLFYFALKEERFSLQICMHFLNYACLHPLSSTECKCMQCLELGFA